MSVRGLQPNAFVIPLDLPYFHSLFLPPLTPPSLSTPFPEHDNLICCNIFRILHINHNSYRPVPHLIRFSCIFSLRNEMVLISPQLRQIISILCVSHFRAKYKKKMLDSKLIINIFGIFTQNSFRKL